VGKRILDALREPADLRTLSAEELVALAGEVRSEIIRTVLSTGGHLASNLGVVELTIALHYCFDFLHDRLIWDVGHQCYTHKILTGRKERFKTLRQYQGLSGFPSKSESPYDPFTTGHSGTSISLGLGLACGDVLSKRERKTVVVIGDGSISSGVPFEAMFHAGELRTDLLVILNDNRMSISRSVGALSMFLARMRAARSYEEARRNVLDLVKRLPQPIESALEHITGGIKGTLGAGGIFAELGFRYFGPLDGHDLLGLVDILLRLKPLREPVLLHVVTQKGKGHYLASAQPELYHSASPITSSNGKIETHPQNPSYTSVFSKSLVECAARDARIVAITAAMPEGTGLLEFKERFPDRYFDVGMCEEHGVAFAGGLAAAGLIPVVAIYSTFLQRSYDQIFHDLALQEASAVLALDRAGIVGADGPTHHGLFDIAYLRHIPGLVIAAPKDGEELSRMLAFALESSRLVAIRYPKDTTPVVPLCSPIRLGEGEILQRGEQVALIAYGAMVSTAFRTATILEAAGIQPTVVNARFVKPIDRELIVSMARSHPLIVTLEDHALSCGFGSAVLETLADAGELPRKFLRLGVPDRFVGHGSREELLQSLELDPLSIAGKVESIVKHAGTGQRGRA